MNNSNRGPMYPPPYDPRAPRNPRVEIPGVPPRAPFPPGGKRPNKESREQAFINSKIANESYTRLGKKTMVGFYTLKNGHEIVTSYQYTDASLFDDAVATVQCRKQASKEIWGLYSFQTQEARYHMDDEMIDTGDIPYGPLKTPEEILSDKEARDVLKQNIKTAEKLVRSEYTEESWEALEVALDSAKAVVDSYSATAEDLHEVNENLIDAMVGLVPAGTAENADEVVE